MAKQLTLLEENFVGMECCGKVDPYLDDSLTQIDSLAKELIKIRDKERPTKDLIEAFSYHHLSLVSLIVLETLKERLNNTKKNRDNPKIALDGLDVIPTLQVATNKLMSAKSDRSFLELASNLQDNASKSNLFQINKSRFQNLDSAMNGVIDEVALS